MENLGRKVPPYRDKSTYTLVTEHFQRKALNESPDKNVRSRHDSLVIAGFTDGQICLG